jgi:hypothetical protein
MAIEKLVVCRRNEMPGKLTHTFGSFVFTIPSGACEKRFEPCRREVAAGRSAELWEPSNKGRSVISKSAVSPYHWLADNMTEEDVQPDTKHRAIPMLTHIEDSKQ